MKTKIMKKFNKHGHKCTIIKRTMSSGSFYCGYVRTNLDVINEYLNNLINVHGGITYGPDDEGWYGIDFSHVGDVCIDEDGNKMTEPFSKDYHYQEWTLKKVKDEVEKLSWNLKQVEKLVEYVR